MTIEEFRAFGGHTKPPMVAFPNENIILPVVTSCAAEPRAQNGALLKAISASTAVPNTLKLKRNKPLARAESNLENALGITRKAK